MSNAKMVMAAGVALLSGAGARGALIFNFNPAAGMDPRAVNAFVAAGARWSSRFSDDMVVNLNVGFSVLGAGSIANTTTTNFGGTYTAIRAAMVADATSNDDLLAVAHLPAGPDISFLTNDFATGNVVVDNNASADNTQIKITRANAKALGLVSGNSATLDGTITFNSALSSGGQPVPYDYDPSDGIDAGAVDFTAVATHEIGHALGFISGVDTVDSDSAPKGFATDFDGQRVFEPLDLFRYSAQSAAVGLLDESTVDASYFSLDGGVTDLGLFSQGALNGDGFQASHWKHLSGEGIMDPTFVRGVAKDISSLDVRAFDVIGYTVVPEPGVVGAVAGLAMVAAGRRRGKRR